MAKTGYMNGSDMLLMVGGKCFGHCTSHSVSMNSETKDRAVKPVMTAGITRGLWKEKGVVGLSISIQGDGLVFYEETEFSYSDLVGLWKAGQPVTVKCFERAESGGSTAPDAYLEGSFVITNVEMSAPAQDDATYSISLENNGEPTTLDETKLTEGSQG